MRGPWGTRRALAELAATHDQELPVDVDVAEAEGARLPGSEPEAVAERKDAVVGRSASGGPGVVGKCRGRLEQLAGVGGVEEEGQPLVGFPSPDPVQRRRIQALLGDCPVEEAAECPDEVVEAAGSFPGPGGDELVKQTGCELT